MRYAMHKIGDSVITQMIEAPESMIKQMVSEGMAVIPVGLEVSDATHLVIDGEVVLKTEVGISPS